MIVNFYNCAVSNKILMAISKERTWYALKVPCQFLVADLMHVIQLCWPFSQVPIIMHILLVVCSFIIFIVYIHSYIAVPKIYRGIMGIKDFKSIKII
jgi:hypothetical protein